MKIPVLSGKPLRTIGLVLGLSLATAGILTPTAQANENLISDRDLAECINSTYGRESYATITKTDLAKLTQLSCLNWSNNITNVSGLEHAINLTRLELSVNRIDDITPIGELSKLTSLDLSVIRLRDITPLSKLTKLTHLKLDYTSVANISPLANLRNLVYLSLRNNRITDISPLSKLTRLKHLDLSANQIFDFSPLGNLSELPAESPWCYRTDKEYCLSLGEQLIPIPVTLPAYKNGLEITFRLPKKTVRIVTKNGKNLDLYPSPPLRVSSMEGKEIEKTVYNNDGSYSYFPLDKSSYVPQYVRNSVRVSLYNSTGYSASVELFDPRFGINYGSIFISDDEPMHPGEPGQPSSPNSNTTQPSTPVNRFIDIAGYPFVKEIEWLAASGVTTGYPDRTFRPHDSVSRAAMAAFLYRLEGKPDYKAPAKSPFTDIKPGDDFYKEICWLASKGVTTGYADKSFKPWDSISREAMAAFLHRYDQKVAAKKLPAKLAAKKFTDTGATPFAKDIAWLSQTGVTTGYADGSFKPYDPIERGAIAAFFYRMKH